MKTKFLIGSLTAGSALALGSTDIAGSYAGAFAIGIIFGVIYLGLTQRRVMNAITGSRVRIDNENERYSETDVRDFFEALSEAKTRSTTPFPDANSEGESDRARKHFSAADSSNN